MIFRAIRLLGTCASLLALSCWTVVITTAVRADDAPASAKSHAATAEGVEPSSDGSAVESTPHDGADKAGKGAAVHDAHAHDPHDLSEGNGTRSLTKPDDLKFDLAFFTAIVFFLLLALLGKFAWGPICHALEAREQGIAAKIDEARVNAERAVAKLQEYELKMAAAADEARELITQARRSAESLKEQIVAEAQAAAQRERDRAVADIAVARDNALRDIAQRSVDTAISLASRIVRRELRPADHQGIVREVLDQLPNQN